MDKKASSVLYLVFEVLAILVVIWMMISVARSFANSDRIVRINVAGDMALMINTLAGIPGNAVVEYPQNVSAYIFVLNSNTVKMFKRNDPPVNQIEKKFWLPQGYDAEGVVEEKEHLCMAKEGQVIKIRECEADEFKTK